MSRLSRFSADTTGELKNPGSTAAIALYQRKDPSGHSWTISTVQPLYSGRIESDWSPLLPEH